MIHIRGEAESWTAAPAALRERSTAARALRARWREGRLPGLFAVILTLAGCTPSISYDYNQEPDPWKSGKYEFVLGPGDKIAINVWNDKELTTDAIVEPDGAVTMPLIGRIQADGRTTKQLSVDIAKRLVQFIKDQDRPVTVRLTDVKSYRFTISGNAEHPGIFSPTYYVRVSEALAMAGGPNKFAAPDKTVVLRNADGKTRQIPIVLSLLPSHPEMDIAVMRGDTLLIP